MIFSSHLSTNACDIVCLCNPMLLVLFDTGRPINELYSTRAQAIQPYEPLANVIALALVLCEVEKVSRCVRGEGVPPPIDQLLLKGRLHLCMRGRAGLPISTRKYWRHPIRMEQCVREKIKISKSYSGTRRGVTNQVLVLVVPIARSDVARGGVLIQFPLHGGASPVGRPGVPGQ